MPVGQETKRRSEIAKEIGREETIKGGTERGRQGVK